MDAGMRCNQCKGQFHRTASTFPGFDLLACKRCGRPIRLLLQSKKKRTRSEQRMIDKRMERAARRSGLIA